MNMKIGVAKLARDPAFQNIQQSFPSGFSMLNIDWVTFVLKLVLVPTFIGAVSLAGRRWGTTVSGWLVGLPFTSGPVAFFLALEQGTVFAAKASEAIMLGIISVYAFCVVYAHVATRTGWLASAVTGIAAFFVSTFLLEALTLPLSIELLLAVLLLVVSLLLMPHTVSIEAPAEHMRWEIPARMVSATALVFLITGLAPLLGSRLTGLLSPFPIYATTLAAFTHRSQGGGEAAKLLRGLIVGSATFILFFLILSLTIVTWGVAASFLVTVGACFLAHLTSLQILRLRSHGLELS